MVGGANNFTIRMSFYDRPFENNGWKNYIYLFMLLGIMQNSTDLG